MATPGLASEGISRSRGQFVAPAEALVDVKDVSEREGMRVSESSVVSPQRIWLFYDREGDFVTHDRFATSVEAQAFARERNLLPWMPPVSAVGV